MADPGSAASTEVHPNVVCERFILANEMLALQGWPVHDSVVPLEEFQASTKSSLAGNMFASSVAMAVFVSTFAAIPWADADDAPDFADEDEASAAMEIARALQ